MKIAVDSNIVLCVLDHDAPLHARASRALNFAGAAGDELLLMPIVPYECWAVLTRPKTANGFGWTPDRARQALRAMMTRMRPVPDPRDLVDLWLAAVAAAGTTGRRAHDWRLAVAAQLAGANAILTFNSADFAGFEGLEVLEPAADLAG